MKQRKRRMALTGIFADVVDYTQCRFGDKDKLKQRYNFEELQDQETQHGHSAGKMIEMQPQIKTGNAVVTMDLMDFLKN